MVKSGQILSLIWFLMYGKDAWNVTVNVNLVEIQ